MPVYNGERFLEQAIASVLKQEYHNFEFIIINDGSRDGSTNIINECEQRDDRIIVITHATNLGIVSALNAGLARARGKYIARMDADDIAAPSRFSRQVERLDRDADLFLVGSWAKVINTKNQTIGQMRLPTHDESIRACMLLGNQFIHSTVMFRQRVIDLVGPYKNHFPHDAEDYDLWLRIVERFKTANIPAYLMRLRRYFGGYSHTYFQAQQDATVQFRKKYLEKLLRQGQQGYRIAIQAFRINPFDPLLCKSLCERNPENDRTVGPWRRRWWMFLFLVRRQVKRVLSSPRRARFVDQIYPR